VSQAPVRAEDHAEHGASYSQGYKILHDQVDSGVSWSGNERNVAFLNLGTSGQEGGGLKFADASSAFGFDFADDARGISSIDWDFDGDLDLFVTNRTAPRLRFLQNNSDRRGQFLVLKLVGTEGNRDAIGARAEVTLRKDDGEVTLLRTVYAGNGFVSQSSKWLHFGLDPGAALKDVVVRWPGGEREVFTELASNGHFVLKEGSGNAVPFRVPFTAVGLAPGPDYESEISDQGAIPLARPFPLPPIAYATMDGQTKALGPQLEGPVLLNLWSETCPPCLVELVEFTKEAERIRKSGLRILALNPDAIADPSGDSTKSATTYLRKTGFPFEAGMLNARSMEILHLAHNNVFLRPDNLPAPTSFLLDQQGRVAVVYRGRVSVDDLLRDLADLTASDPAVWQNRCWPFPGKWIGEPDRVYFMEIAIALIGKDYLEEAGDFLLAHHQSLSVEHDLPETMMLCGTRLLQANELPRAIAVLQAALKLKPDLAEAHNNLGMAFRRSGRDDQARPHLEKAVDLKPIYHDARLNLATLYAASGQFATALDQVELVLKSEPAQRNALFLAGNINLKLQLWSAARSSFEKLLEVQPNHLESLINLGGIHVQLRQYDEAARYYESALRINPKLESVRRSLTDLRNLKK
jgi:tetratricopeptide (TPR) repeat protein